METDTKPNPADFSVNERPRDYEVHFRVSGVVHVEIEADSKEEARAKAEAMIAADEDFGIELDEVREAAIEWVRKDPPMFRVTREGRKMQVSHLETGDLPRQPDERGY